MWLLWVLCSIKYSFVNEASPASVQISGGMQSCVNIDIFNQAPTPGANERRLMSKAFYFPIQHGDDASLNVHRKCSPGG